MCAKVLKSIMEMNIDSGKMYLAFAVNVLQSEERKGTTAHITCAEVVFFVPV